MLRTRANPVALCLHVWKVIELDEHNEKALYRRGQARLLRNEFSMAMTDFQQVLQINPSNRAARAQITVCQDKIKEHHEQDKRTYANMFHKFAERDAKVRQLNTDDSQLDFSFFLNFDQNTDIYKYGNVQHFFFRFFSN